MESKITVKLRGLERQISSAIALVRQEAVGLSVLRTAREFTQRDDAGTGASGVLEFTMPQADRDTLRTRLSTIVAGIRATGVTGSISTHQCAHGDRTAWDCRWDARAEYRVVRI